MAQTDVPASIPSPPATPSSPHRPSAWTFYRMHILGAAFPIVVGCLLYGWRAAATLLVVVAVTLATVRLWQTVGTRGESLRTAQAMWLALLLGLMLPGHLLAGAMPDGADMPAPWAIPVAGGVLLGILMWLLGGSSVHPVLVTYLLLAAAFGSHLVPRWVLYRDRLLVGDISRASADDELVASVEGWGRTSRGRGADAMQVRVPAGHRLTWAPLRQLGPGRSHLAIDDLPPLEDLVLGGHPGPIGASSAIATLVGGLFLLYRGLIDYRIPLLGCLAAYFAMLLLPLPYSVGEGARPWQSLLLSSPRADWATAITFVNYQVVASPLLFAALFLATSPSVRPVSFRGRVVFAMALGIASAAAQLYVSVPHGPYVALLVVSLLTPWLDRWLRARPIV